LRTYNCGAVLHALDSRHHQNAHFQLLASSPDFQLAAFCL
jgi:hypothetical protein